MGKPKRKRRKHQEETALTPSEFDVFLSHVTSDKKAADAVARWIERVFAVKVFVSSIGPGEVWRQKISHAVEQCRAMIVLVTETSGLSQWTCYEAALARATCMPICFVCVGNVDLTKTPFGDLEVCPWKDAESESAAKLLAWVARVVKKPGGNIAIDDFQGIKGPPLEELINSRDEEARGFPAQMRLRIVKDGIFAPEWSDAECARDYARMVDDIIRKGYYPDAVVAIVDHEQQGGRHVASRVHDQLRGKLPFIHVHVSGARGDGSDRKAEIKEEEKKKIAAGALTLLIVDDVCFSGGTIKKVEEELLRVEPGCKVFTGVIGATCDRTRGDLIPQVYAREIHGDYAVFPWGVVSRTGTPDVVPPPVIIGHDWGHSIEFPAHRRSQLTLIDPQKRMRYHFHERRAECVLVLDEGLVGKVENWSSESIEPYTCIMIPPRQRHGFEARERPVRLLEIWYRDGDPRDIRDADR